VAKGERNYWTSATDGKKKEKERGSGGTAGWEGSCQRKGKRKDVCEKKKLEGGTGAIRSNIFWVLGCLPHDEPVGKIINQ